MQDRELDQLTERERAVLDAARSGESTRAIAERLFVSTRTVETHLGSIYRKLRVSGRVALMALLHSRNVAGEVTAVDGVVADRDLERVVEGEPSASRPVPNSSCLVAAADHIGRGTERAALAGAIAEALDGRRSTVLVGGEPGVGKSALVAAVAGDAQEMGVRVLAGRCDADLRAPFLPFIAVLRDAIADIGPEVLAAGGSGTGALVALLPELTGALAGPHPSADPATGRRMLFESVVTVLRQVLDQGPALVVVEDLHWADMATLGLLRHLIGEPTLGGLMVAATFRNTELAQHSSLSGLLADLWREPSVIRMDIEGLSAVETGRLARQVGGSALDARKVEILRARTNGNPFYILQILADLDGSGEVGRMARSVREVVLDRVNRLGRDVTRILEAAAVLGSEFDFELLGRMFELARPSGPAIDVGEQLDLAGSARLVVEVQGPNRTYRFVHDLVQEALSGQMAAVRRAQLHEAAGMAILDLHPDDSVLYAGELAVHFDEAAFLGDHLRAGSWALIAARQALARSAPDDAVAAAERGLVHAEGDDRLVLDLLVVVTEAQAVRMDLDRHRQAMFAALDVARRIGDPLLMARAIDRDTAQLVMGTIDEDLLAVKQEVLAALGPEPTEQRVRLLLSSVYQRTIGGQGWAASDQAYEALTAARELGDADSLVAALYAVASSTLGHHDLAAQRMVAGELTDLSGPWVDAVPERHGLRFRGPLRLLSGDRSGFEADAAELAAFAARTNSTFVQCMLGEWGVLRALLDGDLEAAEQQANAVLAISGDEPNFLLGWLVEMLEVRIRQGRVGELLQLADGTLVQHPDLPVLRAAVAHAHLEAGDGAGARSLIEPLFRTDGVQVGSDWLRPASLGYLAPVVAATLGRAECRALDRELEPYSGQLLIAGAGALVVGSADRLRALLVAGADPDELDVPLLLTASAIELAEDVQSPALATDARLDRVALLRRRNGVGDDPESLTLLDRIRTDAMVMGDARAMARSDGLACAD